MNNKARNWHMETAGDDKSTQHKKTISEPAEHSSIDSSHQGINTQPQQSCVTYSTKEGTHRAVLLTVIIQVCNRNGYI
jgi:hypothetical protein